MSIGLLGKKLGMTHLYDDFGRRVAVTAVQAGPCPVIRVRERAQHGYEAVQLGFEAVAPKRLIKPLQGQFTHQAQGAYRHLREFRTSGEPEGGTPLKVGDALTVELFQDYELVDVTGTSIGKGFQGGVKRWKWSGGGATHGSMSHRAPGSIGSTTTPGRVIRGHHLPGHMGARATTVQSLRIVRRDPEANLLFIEGALPGAEQGLVVIRKSVKRPGAVRKPQAFHTVVVEETVGVKGKAKTAGATAAAAPKKK